MVDFFCKDKGSFEKGCCIWVTSLHPILESKDVPSLLSFRLLYFNCPYRLFLGPKDLHEENWQVSFCDSSDTFYLMATSYDVSTL